MKSIRSYVLWTMYSLGSLLVSIWIAWLVTAQVNFFYPIWYSALKIDQTIAETMPRHLYKKDFIVTDRDEHVRLFAEIVRSVQANGKGLENISYYSPDGKELGQLLTNSEIIHLQDVATLVSLLGWYCIALILFCLLMMSTIIFFRIHMPALNKLCYSMATVVIVSTLFVFAIGVKKFFYWLHTVIFPENHQWFFYYEESLMSTLMKAPALFAPVSIQLIVLGIIIWVIHIYIVKRIGGFKWV